jgi:hypothetical protein
LTGKTAQARSNPEVNRVKRGTARSDSASLSQGLDRLRDALLKRLGEIEAMALEQASSLDQDSTEREQTLRERVATLEASLARTQAESKRKEQEWQVVLQQLEQDRALLAEAWDRLERERVEVTSQPVARGPSPSPAPSTATRQAIVGTGDDPVTRAILWQFQALKSDVRRNAKGRNGR